jgi:hypothetical protein
VKNGIDPGTLKVRKSIAEQVCGVPIDLPMTKADLIAAAHETLQRLSKSQTPDEILDEGRRWNAMYSDYLRQAYPDVQIDRETVSDFVEKKMKEKSFSYLLRKSLEKVLVYVVQVPKAFSAICIGIEQVIKPTPLSTDSREIQELDRTAQRVTERSLTRVAGVEWYGSLRTALLREIERGKEKCPCILPGLP